LNIFLQNKLNLKVAFKLFIALPLKDVKVEENRQKIYLKWK